MYSTHTTQSGVLNVNRVEWLRRFTFTETSYISRTALIQNGKCQIFPMRYMYFQNVSRRVSLTARELKIASQPNE